ncbi:MAG TPA: histidine phosphatase family protein [Nitrospiraceae bacterium]|jgi:broad specificity phosphatase PhoE|nr:histidine phosphatase family protein [Nitrospiraceae bacterium]
MVTTLYLIRHGETEGSGIKRYTGSINVALSQKGAEQMKGTSALLLKHLLKSASSQSYSYLRDIYRLSAPRSEPTHSDMKLQAVYCSDLSRAMKSAEIIAEPHGIKAVVVKDLRERNFGIWEGLTFTEIRERYPEEFRSWADNPLKFSPIGGESTIEVRDRIIPAMEEIINGHCGEQIAIVAHGGVNRIMLCHILGIPLENIFRIEQDNGAVNIIEFWDRYPVMKLLNGRAASIGIL